MAEKDMTTMKAVIYARYGPPEVLQLSEVAKPVPGDNQVLVKVHAASANALDWRPLTSPILARLVRGGLLKPKDTLVGADVAGQVEAVGADVKHFKPGDEVFGVCRGAFAEYVATAETNLAPNIFKALLGLAHRSLRTTVKGRREAKRR